MAAAGIHTFPFLFFSEGTRLHGTLHRNVDDLDTPQPAIVVSGSWLTVKEQMADRYARELAARGFSAFTFDFAGFGHSAGEPRQAEIPMRKIADIRAATDFVRSLSCSRSESVGYLAICASAQYALAAAARGAPIASLVSVAGWFHDAPSIAPFYGGSEGVKRRLQRARSALDTYISSGTAAVVPAYADGDERAGMYFPLDYYADPTRGRVPEWRNEMSEMSWLYWLTFDGIRSANSVSTPTLIVHSDGSALPDNARRIHAGLRGPKELLWMEGSQADFYDQPPLVTAAVKAAVGHFQNTLR
jgi:pimeloyl-ACP methyl ester carboxylesterase